MTLTHNHVVLQSLHGVVSRNTVVIGAYEDKYT